MGIHPCMDEYLPPSPPPVLHSLFLSRIRDVFPHIKDKNKFSRTKYSQEKKLGSMSPHMSNCCIRAKVCNGSKCVMVHFLLGYLAN